MVTFQAAKICYINNQDQVPRQQIPIRRPAIDIGDGLIGVRHGADCSAKPLDCIPAQRVLEYVHTITSMIMANKMNPENIISNLA